MWVAENVPVQQVSMVADLRLRVKAAARVIQINVAPGVESTIVGGPQRVHRVRAVYSGWAFRNATYATGSAAPSARADGMLMPARGAGSGRCCMNTRCGWGGVARTSRDPPQEPHYGDEVEGSSHV